MLKTLLNDNNDNKGRFYFANKNNNNAQLNV